MLEEHLRGMPAEDCVEEHNRASHNPPDRGQGHTGSVADTEDADSGLSCAPSICDMQVVAVPSSDVVLRGSSLQ